MQVLQFGQKLNTPIVLCLGFFGCMHRGHLALIESAQNISKQCNADVALFTFENNHLRTLGKNLPMVYPFDERLQIYQNVGVQYVLCSTFDKNFMSTTADQFVGVLKQYNLAGIVCGFDYTCGCDRKGSNYIKEQFANVCPVEVVSAVLVDNQKVSTTLVRKMLLQNDISNVNKLLSQPYFVCGKVVHGRGVGNSVGFPTANILIDADKALPNGVFVGRTTLDGNNYKCIVNIGGKPTFELDEISVEVHILRYEGNLYESQLQVELLRYLRPVSKFPSVDELVEQLQKDKECALDD